MTMNPLRWLYVAVGLVCVGLGVTAVLTYRHAVTEAAQIAPLKQQLTDLQTTYATLAKAVATRDATTATIRQDRAATTKRLDDATKADPDASRYLSERIPDSVRRAYQPPGKPQR